MEKLCMVTAMPWFNYGIKVLHDRFLVSELASNMQCVRL